jgi:hypothetical protein
MLRPDLNQSLPVEETKSCGHISGGVAEWRIPGGLAWYPAKFCPECGKLLWE